MDVVTNEERIGLLRGKGFDLGPYATRYPREQRTIVRLLADQAAAQPDATWLVFDGTDAVTFGEAHRLANRVANAIGAPRHVALFLRNRGEFMPALIGAMATGGVAVPLNADARGPLLEYVIEKSDSTVVIAQSDLLDRLEGLDSLAQVELVVVLDGDAPDSVCGVHAVRWNDWLDGVSDEPPGPTARARRRRADPVHVGHHRTLEGRRVPAPVSLPVLRR